MNIEKIKKLAGKFIVFEGIEGSGKTTLINILSEHMNKYGLSHIKTCINNYAPINATIRDIILEKGTSKNIELLLFLSAHVQHIYSTIIPSLQKGICILCDRYIDSIYAYQGAGRKISLYKIKWLINSLNINVKPNIIFFLDVPIKTAINRINQRGKIDKIEMEHLYFFKRIRTYYLNSINKNNNYRIINTNTTIDIIKANLISIIENTNI
ncbi:MAG TPA: dTMP kinase [Candidatus Azoamicus sp. OHIO1]